MAPPTKCSAGVGRTGTFITIDTMLRQMEAEGIIDIFNFVRHMRFRRNYMVQTPPQYVFIHDAILEAIMCGDNSIRAPELKKRFQELMEVEPESNKPRIQLQFEVRVHVCSHALYIVRVGCTPVEWLCWGEYEGRKSIQP